MPAVHAAHGGPAQHRRAAAATRRLVAPHDVAAHRRIFGVAPSFGQPSTELVFPRQVLDLLSATPAAGASFDGWTGPCSDASPTCTFTLDADTDVTAGFGIVMHAVSVTIVGNGMVRVTSSPAGIDCPTTCSMMVPDGAAVSLTAMATDTTSQFLGWSDRRCAGTSTCAIMVSAGTAISVAFGQNLSLVVTRSGTGSGTVTSDLPGIAGGITCGTTCAATFDNGTTVTLTASPAPGLSFGGWSGGWPGTGRAP